MRILIAEDDASNRELLTELLRNSGHSVTAVVDGREALAALAKEPFEVVLMDEEMPHMSGLEAARAITESGKPGGRRPIIVGISGNGTKEDEERCLAAGMDAFLAKPVRASELFSVLAMFARRYPVGGPAEVTSPEGLNAENLAAHIDCATGGNTSIAQKLIKTFLGDAPKRLAEIRRAVAESDAGALGSAAHALKGSLSLIGATRAAGTARNLQAMGRLGTLDGAPVELAVLETEFAELRRELAALQVKSQRGEKKPVKHKGSRSRRARGKK
jgi:two-component system, sensor histidine kinase and response regulator